MLTYPNLVSVSTSSHCCTWQRPLDQSSQKATVIIPSTVYADYVYNFSEWGQKAAYGLGSIVERARKLFPSSWTVTVAPETIDVNDVTSVQGDDALWAWIASLGDPITPLGRTLHLPVCGPETMARIIRDLSRCRDNRKLESIYYTNTGYIRPDDEVDVHTDEEVWHALEGLNVLTNRIHFGDTIDISVFMAKAEIVRRCSAFHIALHPCDNDFLRSLDALAIPA